ncbi:MAG: hypothetical protein KF813_15015, partial [Trueperaceae bacterium]|nr:hypothetical protein [Trueperaceae bacterium]
VAHASGGQGGVAFIFRDQHTKTPAAATLLLADGSNVSVPIGQQHVAWCLIDVHLGGRSRIDYSAFNAFAMVGAYYDLAEWLSDFLGTRSESLILALVLLGVTAVGSGLVLGAAALADRLGGAKPNLRASLERWGYVFVASGFGFWGAHYLFHALTGALSIVPVTQHFFEYRGFGVDPDWRLAQVVPSAWLFPLQAVISGLSALLATFVAARIAMRDFGKRGVLALWPVLLLVIVIAGLQVALWAQPMEMRGTLMGPQ